MVAPVVNGILVDTNDAGILLGEVVVPVGYLVGDVLPGGGDAVPPVVSNLSPVGGSTLDVSGTVSERVTDDQALRGVVLVAKFADAWETIYEGRLVSGVWVGSFSPKYTGSTIAAVTGGYDFVCRRTGGWPSGFFLATRAFDTGGNSNAA